MSDVYQAPEASLNEPVAQGEYGSVEGALAGNYELKPIGVLQDAWANLSGMKGTFWAALVVYVVLSFALGLLFGVFGASIESGVPTATQIIGEVIQIIIFTPMTMGLVMIALKHSVGAKIELGELFKHYNKILPLFLGYLISTIAVIIGFLLFIIPGIYLSIAYVMAMILIVEKGMGPWEALETSRKAVTKKWFNMFGFMILASIVVVVGALALLVGLVWALPLVTLAFAMVYRDMFGVEAETLNAE